MQTDVDIMDIADLMTGETYYKRVVKVSKEYRELLLRRKAINKKMLELVQELEELDAEVERRLNEYSD